MSKLICENKYRVGGTKEDVIGLSVSLTDLPKEIQIQGNTLYLKDSFHVSLVCIGIIIQKYNILVPDFFNKVVNDFCDFAKINEIKILHYNNDFRFATENDLKSVVVMCEVSNINKFYDFINEKYTLNIKYPSTHITLYTLKKQLGIFLTDEDDIKNLTVPIENPIGKNL